MLDRLEALSALAQAGTMSRAAANLRITQSAISKRIGALEAELALKLIEREGRRVRLTSEAQRLLSEARPLLLKLRDVLQPGGSPEQSVLRVAATDSLLASFLPAALRSVLELLPTLQIELHAHRGPMLLERVRSGDYALGLCPAAAGDAELVQRELLREAMVIVPAGLVPFATRARGSPREQHRDPVVRVWAIEKRSLTWEAIEARLPSLRKRAGFALEVEARLESFAALVQVARAGFAHALVPRGIARDLGVPSDRLVSLPGLTRPIAAVARRSTFERTSVRTFLALLGDVLKGMGPELEAPAQKSR
jgi:DNA-binding transcriptional LysR family regulator